MPHSPPPRHPPRTSLQAPSVRQFCFYWLPPLLFTGGILALSGNLGSAVHTKELLFWVLSWLPFPWSPPTEVTHGYLRKIGHIAAYGSLYWLWFRAFQGHLSHRLGTAILISLTLCLFTALADEGHQSLVASRTGAIQDVALDFGAAALAALALSFKSR